MLRTFFVSKCSLFFLALLSGFVGQQSLDASCIASLKRASLVFKSAHNNLSHQELVNRVKSYSAEPALGGLAELLEILANLSPEMKEAIDHVSVQKVVILPTVSWFARAYKHKNEKLLYLRLVRLADYILLARQGFIRKHFVSSIPIANHSLIEGLRKDRIAMEDNLHALFAEAGFLNIPRLQTDERPRLHPLLGSSLIGTWRLSLSVSVAAVPLSTHHQLQATEKLVIEQRETLESLIEESQARSQDYQNTSQSIRSGRRKLEDFFDQD